MSVLEQEQEARRHEGTKARRELRADSSPSTLRPSVPSSLPRQSRFATYFRRTGWMHALLLLGVWLFLFPFLWMLATSVKTDEEILEPSGLPQFPTFRDSSPFVRRPTTPIKPADVSTADWNKILPTLQQIASDAIAKHQSARPAQDSVAPFDAAKHRESATALLISTAVAQIDRRLWTGEQSALLDSYRSLLTDQAISSSLSDSLARLELILFQLRTFDLHIFNVTEGADFAKSWRVESGPGKLFKDADATLLSYHFDSPSSPPVVVAYDFRLPAGVKPDNIYKLLFSLRADNSWHRMTATLDVGGDRWRTDECTYIAQYRPLGLILQPPSFDDESMRAKTWVNIRKVGATPDNIKQQQATLAAAGEGIPATLRIILEPSSTLRANWGKIVRNYDRAFKSVPFWRYITNSLLLVILCTVGSLFSASFVAYAFARLHWPGRSLAFVLVLSTMMLPGQVTMIPGFMIWRALHWYNTLNPLWVPAFFGSAFFIFLMTQHMRTIPKDLEEAARIDGLNAVQSWYYVILPNVGPTLAAIAILSFMGAWNEFMGPLIYLRDQARFPLSLGLYGLGLLRTQPGSDYSWSVVMAGNMLMTAPVVIVFFLFQRYFVQGMTMTGMKG
jgi:multiple sugar transport system permease protein